MRDRSPTRNASGKGKSAWKRGEDSDECEKKDHKQMEVTCGGL